MKIKYAYQKYLYANDDREEATANLRHMVDSLDDEEDVEMKVLTKFAGDRSNKCANDAIFGTKLTICAHRSSFC